MSFASSKQSDRTDSASVVQFSATSLRPPRLCGEFLRGSVHRRDAEGTESQRKNPQRRILGRRGQLGFDQKVHGPPDLAIRFVFDRNAQLVQTWVKLDAEPSADFNALAILANHS